MFAWVGRSNVAPAAWRAGTLVRGLAACAAMALPIAGYGQTWRTVTSSRQMRGSEPVAVRVVHAAGTATLESSDDDVLYRMHLRYDAERSAPVSVFDDAARTLTIGTRTSGTSSWSGRSREGSTLRAALGRSAPLDLSVELGAVQADLFLGGLRVRAFELRAGASEVAVDIDRPNAETTATADIDVGAAKVVVRRAGNLRAARARVTVGAGSLDYDLTGEWSGTVEVTANVAVGGLTLRVPPDAGVRVSARTYLAGFDRAGLVRDGDDWVSPQYNEARRRVTVRATTVLGGLDIVRR